MEHDGDITQTAEDNMTPFGMAVSKGAQSVAEYFAGIGRYLPKVILSCKRLIRVLENKTFGSDS